ncbi:acetylserotonin O-methyltransferase [Actinomadura roseirufa]|uniref:acetylserotonin O-methyltransferase n=1 Tax=Actinomadura roseirufa TaxID=2094049 RepID=UPI001F5FA2D2|nr:acetylserotonin O-methyltransferase [Actinomadura roseirufa]
MSASAAPDIGTAQGILRLGNAYCEAQALLTAVELDLFTALHDAPGTEREIAARLGLHGRGLRDFLALLAALGLLEERDGRYANAPAADRHLVSGAPGYVGGSLLGGKANLYPLWNGLTDTLRSGRPRAESGGFERMLGDPEELRRYVRMMEGALRPLVPELLKALDWSAYGSVLDVGGCAGDLAGWLVTEHPGLEGHVFDLPEMEGPFGERTAELGLTGTMRFHGGDFFRDPLPRADVLIFGHVLHNWSPERRALLVRKAFEAVNPGGVLLVHDRMLADGPDDVDNLVASLIMALVTDEGAEYSIGEVTDLAETAGFTPVTSRPLEDNETLVLCHKPA